MFSRKTILSIYENPTAHIIPNDKRFDDFPSKTGEKVRMAIVNIVVLGSLPSAIRWETVWDKRVWEWEITHIGKEEVENPKEINISLRSQDTRSIYKNQLCLYIVAMNNLKYHSK